MKKNGIEQVPIAFLNQNGQIVSIYGRSECDRQVDVRIESIPDIWTPLFAGELGDVDYKELFNRQVEFNDQLQVRLVQMSERMANPPICVKHIDFKDMYEAERTRAIALENETLWQSIKRWWNRKSA